MKAKSKFILIIICFFVSVCSLFFACGKVADVVLSGFTPVESLNVEKGSYVNVENLFVSDQDGDVYKVEVKVLNSQNAEVALSNDGFFADDLSGYTIVYTVTTGSGAQTKRTSVVVSEKISNNFNVAYDALINVGETYTLPVGENLKEQYAFTATVTPKKGGAAIQADGLSFSVAETGYYEIALTGTDKKGVAKTDVFEIYAREQIKMGEVEIFSDEWAVVDSLDARYDRRVTEGWKIVDTTGTTVKNRFGEDDTLLSVTTDENWAQFYFLPRADEAYYRALAEDGYEYISVWLRIDSTLRHKVQRRNGDGRFYWSYVEDSMPNQWMEVRFNLLPNQPEDWTGSFLYFFDEYEKQSIASIVIDNSDEYNPYGGGDQMTIYVDDVFAVKKVEMSVADGFGENLKVGDTLDLSTMVDSENELEYTLSFRSEETLLNGTEYTFRANGEYTLTASVLREDQHLSGSVSKKIVVADVNEFTGENIITERVGATKNVTFANLNAGLENVTGETLSYTVTRFGKPVQADENGFTADKDGAYTVNVACSYQKDGETYCSYHDLTVDVWSEESRFQVFSVFDFAENALGWSHYMNSSWEKLPVLSTVQEKELGGETGDYLKVAANGGQWTCVSVRPYYSKNYYEALAAEREDYSVSYGYYMVDESGEYPTRRLRSYTRPYQEAALCGEWTSVVWTITDFIEYYDYLTEHFAYIQSFIESGKVQYLEKDNKAQALLAAENAQNGVSKRELSLYLTDVTVKYIEKIQTYAVATDITETIDLSAYIPENVTGTVTYAVKETSSGDETPLSSANWYVKDTVGTFEAYVYENGAAVKTVVFELFDNASMLAGGVTDFTGADFAAKWQSNYAAYWDNKNQTVKTNVTVGDKTGTYAYFESTGNTNDAGNANNFVLPVDLSEAVLTYYAAQGYGLAFEIYGDILTWDTGGTINVQLPKYANDGFTWETYAITQKGWTTLTVDINTYLKIWENYQMNGLSYAKFACLLMRPYNGLNGVSNVGHGATAFYIASPYLLKIAPSVGEQADGTVKMTDYSVSSFQYDWSNSYANHWANEGAKSVVNTTLGGKTGMFASFAAGKNSNNTGYNSCFIGSHLTKTELESYKAQGYKIAFDMYGYISASDWVGKGWSLGKMALPTLNNGSLEYIETDEIATETWTTFTVEIDAYLAVWENFTKNGLSPDGSCLIKRNLYYTGGRPDTTFYFTELRLVK